MIRRIQQDGERPQLPVLAFRARGLVRTACIEAVGAGVRVSWIGARRLAAVAFEPGLDARVFDRTARIETVGAEERVPGFGLRGLVAKTTSALASVAFVLALGGLASAQGARSSDGPERELDVPAAASIVLEPAQSSASEDKDESFEKVDPYTKGDTAAMEKAGYESFGPFLFAEGIKTQDVEEALGNVQVLWVETQHFKLGSTLRTYKLKGDPKEEKKLEEELKRLKARLPTIKPLKNKLDPWLRLHLYAMRLEEQYQDFCTMFGLTEADFEAKGAGVSDGQVGGRYLGMPSKFTVLVTDKRSGTGRFLKRFLDRESPNWQRWHLKGGSMFLGISSEALKEYNFDSELALWATMSSEISMNFLEGFRGSGLDVPLWFKAGFAHLCARRVDERYTLSAVGTTKSGDDEASARWEPRVYGLVFNKAAKGWKDTLAWKAWEDLKAQGHLIAWSRVEWLLQRKDAKLRELLLGLAGSLREVPEAERAATVLARHEAAFQAALGKSLADAEAEWRQYVLKTYDKK
ncbi:MAG: hypothetical protein IPJ77_23840 [Planctomycetes bacterium]|nr:hypothetical protein [Planctomycetota bacterium]